MRKILVSFAIKKRGNVTEVVEKPDGFYYIFWSDKYLGTEKSAATSFEEVLSFNANSRLAEEFYI